MSKLLRFFTILFVLLIIVAAGLGYYGFTQFQPVSDSAAPKVNFVVTKGEGSSQIANQLQADHLIKNSLAFRLLVWKNQLGSKFQAGTFNLAPSMTVQQVGLELTTAPTSIRITIKQGLRREEIADFLATQDLSEFKKADFLSLTTGQEGYLFPDTYIISRQATTQSIVDLLKATFDKKVTKGIASEIQQSPHSLKEAVILASILEREAKRPTASAPDDTDMRTVAGILWNRIAAGIPLSVDSSLEYVGGYNAAQQTWWASSSVIDLKLSDSPYNTYKFAGLPPAPISNPALASIEAALNPLQTRDLYYLYGNDGIIHYAVTLPEHNVNIQKYLR